MKATAISLCVIFLTGLSLINAQQTADTKDYKSLFPEPIFGWSASDITVEFTKDNNKADHGRIKSLSRRYYTNSEADVVLIYIIPRDYSLLSYTDKQAEQGIFELLGDQGYKEVSFTKIIHRSIPGIKYTENANHVYKYLINYNCLNGTLTFKIKPSGSSEGYVLSYLKCMDLSAIKSFIAKENEDLNSIIKEMSKEIRIEYDDLYPDDF